MIGVSPDPVQSVKKFADEQALDFTLLADEDHAVCEAYGVWAEKSMYGTQVLGRPARDVRDRRRTGIVAHVIPKVTPRTHDDEVLAVLEQLAAA